MSKAQGKTGDSHISENKNAKKNFIFLEKVEAGLVLTGTEVKSIRNGDVNINDSYATLENEEAYLLKMHIAPYSHGNRANHDPLRKRKLLLHREQIKKLIGSVVEKGLTLIPSRLYWVKGRVKVELVLAKGKTKDDRRQSIRKRDAEREMDKAMKRSKKY